MSFFKAPPKGPLLIPLVIQISSNEISSQLLGILPNSLSLNSV